MNQFLIEQLRVIEMLKRINPDRNVSYEGMMEILQKANPDLIGSRVSPTFKRIMYLQLITHSIEESCSVLKHMTFNEPKAHEISDFAESVKNYCKGFVDGSMIVEDDEIFIKNQQISSEIFLIRWEEITEYIKESCLQESATYIQ